MHRHGSQNKCPCPSITCSKLRRGLVLRRANVCTFSCSPFSGVQFSSLSHLYALDGRSNQALSNIRTMIYMVSSSWGHLWLGLPDHWYCQDSANSGLRDE